MQKQQCIYKRWKMHLGTQATDDWCVTICNFLKCCCVIDKFELEIPTWSSYIGYKKIGPLLVEKPFQIYANTVFAANAARQMENHFINLHALAVGYGNIASRFFFFCCCFLLINLWNITVTNYSLIKNMKWFYFLRNNVQQCHRRPRICVYLKWFFNVVGPHFLYPMQEERGEDFE